MSALLIIAVAAVVVAASQQKIELSPANVVNGFGTYPYNSSGVNMLDEQVVAGDPAAGTGGTCTIPWQSSWDATYYGAQAHPFFIIDLNGTFSLTSIFAYRSWGTHNVSMLFSHDGFTPSAPGAAWVWAFGTTIPPGQGWINQSFTASPISGRYLTVTADGPTGSGFLELVLYGAQTAPPPPPPSPVFVEVPLLSSLLGANGFVWIPPSNYSGVVGAIREYEDADWSQHVANESAFQPIDIGGFMLDDFYGNASALGVAVHQCSQKSPQWVHGGSPNASAEMAWKPLSDAQFATPLAASVAASYRVAGDHAFQVSARYGRTPVPLSALRLVPGQPPKTALGTLSWFEPMNEVDGTWNDGRNGFYASVEYAAHLSAAFDGHGGTMGPGMGALAADPTMRVATSGLAGFDTAADYFETMRLWSAVHRPRGDFPAHALNVHHYSQNAAETAGVSPEEDDLAGKLAALCAYRDGALPGKQVWLSEFGYDTVGGPQVAPPIGPHSSQVVQGMWLLRSVLAIARAGMGDPAVVAARGACASRAHMYMLQDVESSSGGKYATSGLLASADFLSAPKASWYHYSAMMAWVADFSYVADVALGPAAPGAMAACFRRANATAYALIAWLPTSNASVLAGVSVAVSAGACPVAPPSASVHVVVPQAPLPRGNVSTGLVSAAGSVVVTLSEMPLIIVEAAGGEAGA